MKKIVILSLVKFLAVAFPKRRKTRKLAEMAKEYYAVEPHFADARQEIDEIANDIRAKVGAGKTSRLTAQHILDAEGLTGGKYEILLSPAEILALDYVMDRTGKWARKIKRLVDKAKR